MEKNKELRDWLNLLIRPGFYVEEGRITQVNAAAQGLLLEPGMDIAPLITSGLESYQNFQTGCLYVQLTLSGMAFHGCVTKDGSADVFILESDAGDTALQALSLAAQELRSPLSAVMHGVQAMCEENNPQAAALNRGLYQLLRLVGNMSDAGLWPGNARMETADLTAFFDELFEKTAVFAQAAGIRLEYQGLSKPLLCLADRELLERAVLNLLSNAFKFTPKGGTVRVTLFTGGTSLRLSVWDSGPGIAQEIQGNLFSRYLRQPGIEDSRFGLGLGMVLVRSAAAAHGGAVLIDQPEGWGTRVTLTIALRRETAGVLRSPTMRIDYAGERDHALTELSDCLPVSLYKKEI